MEQNCYKNIGIYIGDIQNSSCDVDMGLHLGSWLKVAFITMVEKNQSTTVRKHDPNPKELYHFLCI